MNRRAALATLILMTALPTAACSEASEHLVITSDMLAKLRAIRAEQKFAENAIMTAAEKAAMTQVLDPMLDRLLLGLEANPSRAWVVDQIRPAVAKFYLEDTEVREPCVDYLVRVYQALGLGRSAGAYGDYLIEF